LSSPEELHKFDTLVGIIAQLRGPGGCPWDRKQTHASLRENLLSECYEVLAALDDGDTDQLGEELGDLLLQIVLHAQIASEAGEFTLSDVVYSITTKLVHRHPHIFGNRTVADAEEVMLNWEALKEEERGEGVSMLDGVPRRMPALSYSYEVQKRVARVGFDWESLDGVIDKLVEEIGELRQAGSQEQQAHEFGDLLFTLVNIARRMGIDAEAALRKTNQRFYRRFSRMEEICRQRGLNLRELSLDEQDVLWEEAKGEERPG